MFCLYASVVHYVDGEFDTLVIIFKMRKATPLAWRRRQAVNGTKIKATIP
jgi:hypothetical protein